MNRHPSGRLRIWTVQRRRDRAFLTAVDFTRGQTIAGLAERLGVHPLTARKYLLRLEADGAVRVDGYEARAALWVRCG